MSFSRNDYRNDKHEYSRRNIPNYFQFGNNLILSFYSVNNGKLKKNNNWNNVNQKNSSFSHYLLVILYIIY